MFNATILHEAIQELAKAGRIYSNEAQFQFELAWKLKEKGFDVELEVLSAAGTIGKFVGLPKEEKEKQYTDIIVKDEEGYIAIELKFKTKNLLGGVYKYTNTVGDHYVFSQGASNVGAYLFWEDIQRLEKMVTGEIPLNFDDSKFDESKKVKKGYAVLMTNDSIYWERRAPFSGYPGSLCGEFYPSEGYTPKSPLCRWIYLDKSGGVVKGCPKGAVGPIRIETVADAEKYIGLYKGRYYKKPSQYYPIELTGTYTCNWEKYDCQISKVEKIDKKGKITVLIPIPEFKYLLLEVK